LYFMRFLSCSGVIWSFICFDLVVPGVFLFV
jgi:hypothetical protein